MATTDLAFDLSDGRRLKAFLATPAGPGPHPGVIVLHEAFGLTPDIRRIAERFANEGYVAVAPDLYSHGQRLTCLSRVMLDTLRGARDVTIADIEATRAALLGRDDVNPAHIGIIGFCQGGGFALAFASRGGPQAVSVNYGAVPKRRSALERVCPVVGSYGGLDKMFAKQAAMLDEHLTALGVPHDVKIYPGAGHSFLNDHSDAGWVARLPMPIKAGHSPAEAEDAWARIFAFFALHVGGLRGSLP